jgi:hypothetical protein
MHPNENILSDWEATRAEEMVHDQTLENGCRIDVRVRQAASGQVQQLVGVYASDGSVVHLRATDMDAAQWKLEDALSLGIDQAQRLAGGESGRLPDANV